MTKTLHHAHPTGIALALTAGVLYTLCALAVMLWPMQTIQFFNTWLHAIDISKMYTPPQITVTLFLQGLGSIMVTSYLIGMLFAWLYNKCVDHCQRKGWI